MTWVDSARTAAGSGSGLFDGGFGWGTFLLVLGMFVALAVVSSLGILARMRDRANEQTAMASSAAGAGQDDPRSDRSGGPTAVG